VREGSRLLVVDDNKVNRLLLARSLELQGHGVDSAGSRVAGDAAPRRLRPGPARHGDAGDGRLHRAGADDARPAAARPSVIVTSSLEGIDNIVRCIELGAEDYLTSRSTR
jgi:CheY-like chemotaxis protein